MALFTSFAFMGEVIWNVVAISALEVKKFGLQIKRGKHMVVIPLNFYEKRIYRSLTMTCKR